MKEPTTFGIDLAKNIIQIAVLSNGKVKSNKAISPTNARLSRFSRKRGIQPELYSSILSPQGAGNKTRRDSKKCSSLTNP
jgi:hypothetical protein